MRAVAATAPAYSGPVLRPAAGSALALASGLVLVVALAACGGHHGAAAPPSTAASGTTTTVPGPTAPPGARLAIATSQGVEIWSESTGIFTVGPTVRGVDVSDMAWSDDGRYLSWQTVPSGSRRRGTELWYVALASGITHHWGPRPGGGTYGPVVVTDTGVLSFGPSILRFSPGGPPLGASVAVPAVGPLGGAMVQAWAGGWVVEPGGSLTGQAVQRFGTDGLPVPPGLVLDASTSHGPHFDLEAIDRSGTLLAAELGTHGRGCEDNGTAQLWTAVLPTSSVRYSTPPRPFPTDTERFWDIDVSGPDGSVYASTFDCATGGHHRGEALTTVLWRFRAGDWFRLGAGLVAGDRAGDGPLATLSGEVRVSGGSAAVTGAGTVRVGGRIVATGGQAISWAPYGPAST